MSRQINMRREAVKKWMEICKNLPAKVKRVNDNFGEEKITTSEFVSKLASSL